MDTHIREVDSRSDSGIPKVDFPDWQLVREIASLLGKESIAGRIYIGCQDSRAEYGRETVEEVVAELEAREEKPLLVWVNANVAGRGDRSYMVRFQPRVIEYQFASLNEKDVAYMEDAVKRAFRKAAQRRRGRRLGYIGRWLPEPREITTRLVVVSVVAAAGLVLAAATWIFGLFLDMRRQASLPSALAGDTGRRAVFLAKTWEWVCAASQKTDRLPHATSGRTRLPKGLTALGRSARPSQP